MKTRHCHQCGKDKPETLEYFYKRGNNGKFCASCIECKLKYAAKVKEEKKKYAQRLLKLEGQRRNTPEGFAFYMLNRPHYFRDRFKKEPTPENIKKEFENIVRYIDGQSILSQLRGFGDVRMY